MTPNLFNRSSDIHLHILHHITPTNSNIRKSILCISKQFFKVFLPSRGRVFSSFLKYWRWKWCTILRHLRDGGCIRSRIPGSGGIMGFKEKGTNEGEKSLTMDTATRRGLRLESHQYRVAQNDDLDDRIDYMAIRK